MLILSLQTKTNRNITTTIYSNNRPFHTDHDDVDDNYKYNAGSDQVVRQKKTKKSKRTME